MSFIAVGTNHKYSPIGLREKISFSKKRIGDALDFLQATTSLKEAVILSTCNRVEIYASTDCAEDGIDEIKNFFSRFYEINEKTLFPYLYIYRDRSAVRHLFRVSSGLDSLIVGESQIMGQVRAALYESERSGFAGYSLNKIFDSAVLTAKKAHSLTGISKGKVSIGSVAVDFIKEKSRTLSGKNILIIGVGKVTGLVLKYLEKEGRNVVFLSNRTFEKARFLADQIGAKAVRFDNLKEYLTKADIVITATESPHFIIKKSILDRRFTIHDSRTTDKRLLIIDLALPRDVDPEIREIDSVELFGLEDLGAVIDKNRDRKRIEAGKAEQIIEIEVGRTWQEILELEQEKALLQ